MWQLYFAYCCLQAASNNTKDVDYKLSEDDSYYLELAKNANSVDSIDNIIESHDSEAFQMELAHTKGDFYFQQILLKHQNLKPSVLTYICLNPDFSKPLFLFEEDDEKLVIEAILASELTQDQKDEISNKGNSLMKEAILIKDGFMKNPYAE